MIQLHIDTIGSTSENSTAKPNEEARRKSKASKGLKVKVVSELVPLGLWAVQQLEKAGHSAHFERSNVVNFETRHAPSVDAEKLNALLNCVRPFFTIDHSPDYFLRDGIDVELYLGGEAIEAIMLSVQADSSELLHRVSVASRDCNVTVNSLCRQHVSDNKLKLNDNVGPFQRAVLIWMVEQITPKFHLEFEEQPTKTPIAVLSVRDDELHSLPIEQRYPIVLQGDESETMEEMRAWLESRGCRVEFDKDEHEEPIGPMRLDIVNGPYRSLEGRSFVEEVAGKLRSVAEEQGIDLVRYPVQVHKFLSDQAVLRLRMPTKACREQTLRPWGGPYPERFNILILSDDQLDPACTKLASRLRRAGLTNIKFRAISGLGEFEDHEILEAPAPGTVLIGELANYPTYLRKLEQAVNGSLAEFQTPQEFTCNVRKVYEDDDVDVAIHLPTRGMRDGEYLASLNSTGHYEVTLMSPSPSYWEPLKKALEKQGFNVNTRSCPDGRSGIRYGGARPAIIQQIQNTILEFWRMPPMAIKTWPSADMDIHINLPELDEPLKETDSDEDLDAEIEKYEAMMQTEEKSYGLFEAKHSNCRVEERSFVHLDGNELLVGPLRLKRRVQNASGYVPAVDQDYCVDNQTAKTLQHIAQSVLLREPCLLEGETASSKTSAIMHLASLLNQPLKRINLNGQTDTGDLIGRFVPNAEEAGQESQSNRVLSWRWMEGDLLRAMREGWWVILDEVNLAEPQILERLNSLLEFNPTLVVTEFNGEKFGAGGTGIHPEFRIFATMNPAEYAGRTALSPAYKDRWSGYLQTVSPGETEYSAMLTQLVFGTPPEVKQLEAIYRGPTITPRCASLAAVPEIGTFLERLARFHASIEAAAGQRTGATAILGADRKEKLVFTRRSLLSVVGFLSKSAECPEFDLQTTCRAAFARYYLNRAASAADKSTVEDLLNAYGIGPKNWSISA